MTDPNKLVRRSAGEYSTADDRFAVRGEANRWFVVDTEQADELGQELVRGPFATLDEVRQEIPNARRAQVKPPAAAGRAAMTAKARPTAKAKPASVKPSKPKRTPPPSWIDKLPSAEAARVRALVRALEREGIADAELLARRDVEGLAPEVVRRLIERRLAALLEDIPERDRAAAAQLIQRAAAVLTAEGTRLRRELPGWLLVEIGPQSAPPNRRINLAD